MGKKIDYELARKVVDYYNKNNSTLRATGDHFGISSASVHKYITKVYPNETSEKIREANKKDAPYRAGEAFKNKCFRERLI